jgi:glycerophosphoryl diester phosphodiesterase
MHSDKRRINVFWFVLCLMLMNLSCSEKEQLSDDTFFGSKVMILGHRGMGENYKMPGNTYEAIAPAVAIGVDGCEIDIQLTKDTVLVLFHDHLLNSKTTCTGRIYESDWSDIKQCKYYSLKNNIFINSVDELFAKLPNLNDIYFSFDCSKVDKDVADIDLYQDQYLRAIKRLCEKYNMSGNVFLEGSESLLKRAQNLGLTNKLFLFSYLDEYSINIAKSNNFFGISTSIDWLYVDASLAHEKGLYVMVWSPNNDAQNKDALRKKVDIIQTDDPMTILKFLERYNYEYVVP